MRQLNAKFRAECEGASLIMATQLMAFRGYYPPEDTWPLQYDPHSDAAGLVDYRTKSNRSQSPEKRFKPIGPRMDWTNLLSVNSKITTVIQLYTGS